MASPSSTGNFSGITFFGALGTFGHAPASAVNAALSILVFFLGANGTFLHGTDMGDEDMANSNGGNVRVANTDTGSVMYTYWGR